MDFRPGPVSASSSCPPFATAVVARDLPSWTDAPSCWQRLRSEPLPWWLDSALAGGSLGRHSFMGSDPYLVVRSRGARIDIECRRAVRPDLVVGLRVGQGDPLEVLRGLWRAHPGAGVTPEAGPDLADCPFLGGAVGYLGYETGEWTEPVRLSARDELGLADAVWLFVDRLLAFDHETGRVRAIGLGFHGDPQQARQRAARAAHSLAARLSDVPAPPRSRTVPATRLTRDDLPASLRADFDEKSYGAAVRELLREIAAGNVYQVNLTHRLEVPFAGDVLALYDRLRTLSPAPFAAYLGLPEVAVLSSSPERFLRLDRDGTVESRPIKGTRPRGETAEEDARLRDALSASTKDRAENLMIVDLVRNDLGRVCEPGTVHVPDLMAVEDYASVFQMVSTVRGRLARDRDAVDLLRATFPPGSMTGAPRIAAMEIIDRMEPVRRGVYSGAIGYLDLRGGMDLSVAIRTLVVSGGRAHVHVGGGVVADSRPAEEWRETLDKARPLLAALAGGDRAQSASWDRVGRPRVTDREGEAKIVL